MNILRIVPYFHLPEANIFEKSGFSQSIYELNETQLKQGHSVYMLSNYRKQYKSNNFVLINPVKFLNGFKSTYSSIILMIKYWFLYKELLKTQPKKKVFFNLYKSASIVTILDRKKIDVIHIHSLSMVTIPYLLRLIKADRKYLLTLHFRYDWNVKFMRMMLNLVDTSAGKISVISDALKQDIIDQGYQDQIFINTDGYCTDRAVLGSVDLTYGQYFQCKDCKYLLFAGSLTERKNLLYLLANINKIKFNYKLIVCGDGPLRGKIQNFLDLNDLNDNVFLLGNIDYNLMPYFYRNVDIVCVPSKSEAFGRMFIEAAALGTPTLTFEDLEAVNNLKELKGFHVAKRDSLSFFSELNNILSLKFDRKKLVESASSFTWFNRSQEYENIYNSIKIDRI